MTVESIEISPFVVLARELSESEEPLTVFSLPHPSNIKSKERVKLIEGPEGQLFELKSHTFGKSCPYNYHSDLADDRYHYTMDAQPLKSVFLTNETDRTDGHIIESSTFQFTSKYDITFNLIGFHYRECVVTEEKDYSKDKADAPIFDFQSQEPKCLTIRDYHDLLVDSHDQQWSMISLKSLEHALSNISEPIVEAGEVFYRVTPQRITRFLVSKVQKILLNFPKSLPVPSNMPAEVQSSLKLLMSTNLLISLIPEFAYRSLRRFSPHAEDGLDVTLPDISKAFEKIQEYEMSKELTDKEQDLQLKAAMTVGLSTGSTRPTNKVVKKMSTTKRVKVVSGKGSIDGFFRKAK